MKNQHCSAANDKASRERDIVVAATEARSTAQIGAHPCSLATPRRIFRDSGEWTKNCVLHKEIQFYR